MTTTIRHPHDIEADGVTIMEPQPLTPGRFYAPPGDDIVRFEYDILKADEFVGEGQAIRCCEMQGWSIYWYAYHEIMRDNGLPTRYVVVYHFDGPIIAGAGRRYVELVVEHEDNLESDLRAWHAVVAFMADRVADDMRANLGV